MGYRLTSEAEADLDGIADYGFERYGLVKGREYRFELDNIFTLLSEQQFMGRNASKVRKGLRRHEHGEHVIFYMIEGEDIVIVRLLGKKQQPKKHIKG